MQCEFMCKLTTILNNDNNNNNNSKTNKYSANKNYAFFEWMQAKKKLSVFKKVN